MLIFVHYGQMFMWNGQGTGGALVGQKKDDDNYYLIRGEGCP